MDNRPNFSPSDKNTFLRQLTSPLTSKPSPIMAYTSTSSFDEGSDGEHPDLGQFFGPGHVDQAVRQSIQACWMALPKSKRTVEEVEMQIRRLVERALKDLAEDGQIFGEDEDA